MNINDVKNLTSRKILINSEGKRCRVNGKIKLWKTRPNEFQLPVKAGLYAYGYITQNNCGEWNVE